MKIFVCLLLLVLTLPAFAEDGNETLPVREPIVLQSGEPLVCIYYFTHWWEPWRSSDEKILQDFKLLRQSGFNTILLDHEYSQAMDGDFRLLDRGHRLAKEAGLQIVPWLSLKTFSDMTSEARRQHSQEKYGASVTVTDEGFLPYGDGTIDFAVAYAEDYLERYKDEALLYVRQDGEKCPVISLTVEAAWLWQSSLDSGTRVLFIQWLRDKYETVESLNVIWRTEFDNFFQIDPTDEELFDYQEAMDSAKRVIPQPVMDHVLFRAELVSDAMSLMKARLRKTWPNLLIVAEIPYPFADEHPHAWSYTLDSGSIAPMVKYADWLILRGGGRLTQKSRDAISDHVDMTGQKVVVAHRISPTQGPGRALVKGMDDIAKNYANEAAIYFNGIGYYSWNEMVDVHMFPNEGTSAPADAFCQVTQQQYEELMKIVTGINFSYRKIYEQGKEEVESKPALLEEQGLRTIY